MTYWLWTVDQENWPHVKRLKVWGVQKQRKTKEKNVGDYIIFYVKGTGYFQGIFKIISEWKDLENDLSDVEYLEQFQKFPFRCQLEEICFGFVNFKNIIHSLDCRKNVASMPNFILQNTSWGSANVGKPLSDHDFELIKKEMLSNPLSKSNEFELEGVDNYPQQYILSDKDDIEDSQMTPTHYDVSIMPADYTLEVLYEKFKNKEIIIPPFQRNFVWNIVQSSRLIESFMMGLPIPPIYLYLDENQDALVIDGSQRLRTIFYYFKGNFSDEYDDKIGKKFKLVGINPQQKFFKKTFDELDAVDKKFLKNQVLRSVLIKQISPNTDDTSIYHIFERLNTGGTSLRDQEVRNCVYAGSLNNLLLSLNKYSNWRLVLGKSSEDNRQKDVQLILQYLAFSHDLVNYKRPMKEFLNKFMKKFRNPSKNFLQTEEELFKKVCDVLINHFGIRPLNPKGSLNKSIFDTIFVVFAKHIDNIPSNIEERWIELQKDPIFQKYTTKGTTNTDAIKSRFIIAEEILFLNK